MGKSKDYFKGEVGELKRVIHELKKDIKRLQKVIEGQKKELKTLKYALNDSILYINDDLANIPVEQIIAYFKDKKRGKLDEVHEHHKEELNNLKEKWKCHKCLTGYLRMVLLDRGDKKFYMRVCVNVNCGNRTVLKPYTSDIEGITE